MSESSDFFSYSEVDFPAITGIAPSADKYEKYDDADNARNKVGLRAYSIGRASLISKRVACLNLQHPIAYSPNIRKGT